MTENVERGRGDSSAAPGPERAPLSEREIEILRLVASGASNKEIAARLTISPNTVKVHVRNIFGKIDVQSRTEAAMVAIQRGYVEVPGLPQNLPADEPDDTEADPPTGAEGPTLPQPSAPGRRAWLTPVILVAALVVFALAAWRFLVPASTPAPAATVTAPERWLGQAPLPDPVIGPAVALHENQIYVIGGENTDGPVTAVRRYDPATGAWEPRADKPLAAADTQAATIGGRIFVPGGRSVDGAPQRALEIYNPRADTWERGADLPVALSGFALVALDGKLLLFGGWDGTTYSNRVFEYAPEDDRWRERTTMPTARGFAAAAVVGGRVYVIGGTDGDRALIVNEAYSPESEDGSGSAWETGAPLPDAGANLNAAVVADVVHVFGGAPGAPSIWASFNASANEWTRLDSPQREPLRRAGVIATGPLIHLLGGVDADQPSDQHMAYQAIYINFIPFVESGDR
ncbi:MAG: hypothetical protein JNL73_09445 [Anaerolineales bacterium]|nr:hypothetical protein [Anaerolineales bacterium]